VKHSIAHFLIFLISATLGPRLGVSQEVAALSFIVPQDGEAVAGPNVLVWVAEDEPCRSSVVFETSSDGNRFQMYRSEENSGPNQCAHTTGLDTSILPPGPLFLRTRALDESTGPVVKLLVRRPPSVSCLDPVRVSGNPFLFKIDCSNSRAQGAKITSYQWDFGDGTALDTVEAMVTHRYSGFGTFLMQVTVVDDSDLSSTSITPIMVGK
jgi:hypothetical protein